MGANLQASTARLACAAVLTSGKMIPLTPLSSISEMLGSSQLRARTSTAVPQPSPTCAMCPIVSSENNECWPSMKMKS